MKTYRGLEQVPGQALLPGVVGAAPTPVGGGGWKRTRLQHEDDARKAGKGFCEFRKAQEEYNGQESH